jgi:GNAT superfamily N-acetyltransferase
MAADDAARVAVYYQIVYARIRPALEADMPHVWGLIQDLAEFEKLPHAVTGSLDALLVGLERDFECFVAEEHGSIIGYMLGFRTYSSFRTQPGFWLEDIYVRPDRRGGGVGKRMLEHLIEVARDKGYGRVEWSVLDWNIDAIGFYEAFGAEVMPDWRTCRVSLI